MPSEVVRIMSDLWQGLMELNRPMTIMAGVASALAAGLLLFAAGKAYFSSHKSWLNIVIFIILATPLGLITTYFVWLYLVYVLVNYPPSLIAWVALLLFLLTVGVWKAYGLFQRRHKATRNTET